MNREERRRAAKQSPGVVTPPEMARATVLLRKGIEERAITETELVELRLLLRTRVKPSLDRWDPFRNNHEYAGLRRLITQFESDDWRDEIIEEVD